MNSNFFLIFFISFFCFSVYAQTDLSEMNNISIQPKNTDELDNVEILPKNLFDEKIREAKLPNSVTPRRLKSSAYYTLSPDIVPLSVITQNIPESELPILRGRVRGDSSSRRDESTLNKTQSSSDRIEKYYPPGYFLTRNPQANLRSSSLNSNLNQSSDSNKSSQFANQIGDLLEEEKSNTQQKYSYESPQIEQNRTFQATKSIDWSKLDPKSIPKNTSKLDNFARANVTRTDNFSNAASQDSIKPSISLRMNETPQKLSSNNAVTFYSDPAPLQIEFRGSIFISELDSMGDTPLKSAVQINSNEIQYFSGNRVYNTIDLDQEAELIPDKVMELLKKLNIKNSRILIFEDKSMASAQKQNTNPSNSLANNTSTINIYYTDTQKNTPETVISNNSSTAQLEAQYLQYADLPTYFIQIGAYQDPIVLSQNYYYLKDIFPGDMITTVPMLSRGLTRLLIGPITSSDLEWIKERLRQEGFVHFWVKKNI